MYEQYWGLNASPFANRLSQTDFYESSIHEEALARLLYCVEQSKALAVLHGPPGCGKSQLLHTLLNQVRRTQRFFARLHLGNLSESEFLDQLESQLRLEGQPSDPLWSRWLKLMDFFRTTHETRLQTVLLLDGLEETEDSTVLAIRRLVHLHHQASAHLTIVVSLNHGPLSENITELLELADMGIEVRPLGREETEGYVRNRLASAGTHQPVFQADALDQLQQLSGGVPREINRFCDLALLAGMSEARTAIDRQLMAGLGGESPLPVSMSTVNGQS